VSYRVGSVFSVPLLVCPSLCPFQSVIAALSLCIAHLTFIVGLIRVLQTFDLKTDIFAIVIIPERRPP
jgi:hypothetical protein